MKITQKPYKPYIIPTLYGLAFFFLILNIFALGYYRYNAPFHTVALTMSILGLVAMIQSNDSMRGIRAEILHIELGEEGQLSKCRILLRSGPHKSHFNLLIEPDKSFATGSPSSLDFLRGTASVELSLRCGPRGIYQLKALRISSRGLFGLFYTWIWLPLEQQLVVYPRPEGTLPLPLSEEDLHGIRTAADDFAGHRPYQAGISPKHIDWKAYARGQALLIKDFQRRSEGGVQLKWAATEGSDPERRLRQLAAWSWLCYSQNRHFSLELPQSQLARSYGLEHLHEALKNLAAFQESA